MTQLNDVQAADLKITSTNKITMRERCAFEK